MSHKKSPSKRITLLFRSIKQIIEDARNSTYRAANFTMVRSYWHIGKLIVEEEQNGRERAEYGEALLEELAGRLTEQYGKSFSNRNLRHMRQFYRVFPKWNALRSELSWTHYRLLLKVEKEETRGFYKEECIECKWSTRTLERQINSLYYERMLMSGKKGRSLIREETENKKELMEPKDIIKDPYVLEFLNLKDNKKFRESDLEQAIIDQLQDFLLELGKGFSFVGRQYRLSAGTGKHFYADLVFYNYILKCFLVIDLKTGELTHQDIGQMDMYIRYFEEHIRQKNDNPTIGLILCTEKNKTIVKYSLLNNSKQLFASQYKIYLPTEKQLQQEIKREREIAEMERRLQ